MISLHALGGLLFWCCCDLSALLYFWLTLHLLWVVVYDCDSSVLRGVVIILEILDYGGFVIISGWVWLVSWLIVGFVFVLVLC